MLAPNLMESESNPVQSSWLGSEAAAEHESGQLEEAEVVANTAQLPEALAVHRSAQKVWTTDEQLLQSVMPLKLSDFPNHQDPSTQHLLDLVGTRLTEEQA